jgi:hypothetical protein
LLALHATLSETKAMQARERQPYIDGLDWATRTDLVRAALRDGGAEIASWSEEDAGGGGSGSQLFRVRGDARVGGALVPWRFVLKVLNHQGEGWQESSTDPRSWDYWKREWLAYQDPLLQQMQGSLRAPRCLGAGEQGDAAVWMALEDLAELDQRPWPESRFGIVARHLGEFNGSFPADSAMPSPSWLSRDWLRGWTERAESMITLLPGVADHPLVSRVYPPERIEALLEVWEHRRAWYAALDALPQTICHQDVFPRNAFVRHADRAGQADETIAIDWAFCGKAPVGAELAALIEGSLAFFELERDAADRVEGQCLTSYMEGLADAGWEGAAEDVQLGYLASLVLRFIGAVGPVLTVLLDETLHRLVEQIFGQPMDVFVTNSTELAEFERERISQMRRLLADR